MKNPLCRYFHPEQQHQVRCHKRKSPILNCPDPPSLQTKPSCRSPDKRVLRLHYRRPQLRYLSGQCQRGRGTPRRALLEPRPHAGADAATHGLREPGVSVHAGPAAMVIRMSSEGRSPKAERRPKLEIRTGTADPGYRSKADTSAFFRPSVFGLRPSSSPLHTPPELAKLWRAQ